MYDPGLEPLGESATARATLSSPPPMSAVKTQTEELADSRVRVEVEVGSDAIEREVASAAGEIGRDMKVPGFRKGKVPPQVVLQQVGREAVLDEAVRRALPGWYEDAVQDAGIATVGSPNLDMSDLPEKGAPLAFTFEVGVRPRRRAGRLRGRGGRPPRGRGARGGRRGRARAPARVARLAGDRRARGRRAATTW